MPVDGVAAARTLLSYDGIHGGYCLYYVWQAYKAHGASTGRSAPTATEAWYRSDGRHPGDRNPPPGVPVFWGPKASSNAGDVVISLGGGRVAATDYPYYGVTGVCTIDERERQIGRPYLGWAERIFDQAITLPAPAGRPAEPQKENDMEKDEREALMAIKSALLDGHPSTGLDRRRIDVLFERTNVMHDRLFVYDENGNAVWDAFQELRQNVRALLVAVAAVQAPAEADVEKLADAIFDGLDDEFASKIIDRMAQRLAA